MKAKWACQTITTEETYKYLLEGIYELKGINTFEDCSNIDLYVEKNDAEYVVRRNYGIRLDPDALCNYFTWEPKIEFLTKSRLEPDKIYYKVVFPNNIHIFKENDCYYTLDDVDKKYIDKSEEIMIHLKDFIEINETLNYSLNTKSVVRLLAELIGIDLSKIRLNNTKTKLPQIEFYTEDITKEFEDIDEFIKTFNSFANRIGYRASNDFPQGKDRILLDPYHPEKCNDIVYDENKGIVYHLTSKYFYDKIKNSKYIPFRSDFHLEGKSRIYCYCGDINSMLPEIKTFRNLNRMATKARHPNKDSKYYDKNFLLKIDLNKNDSKIDFYYDPSYKMDGRGITVFTRGNILTDCIVKTYEVNDKKELE